MTHDTRSIIVFFQYFKKRRYQKRIAATNDSLGIPENYGPSRNLPLQLEARKLVSIGCDIFQRDQRMSPGAAVAWQAMCESAAKDRIILQAVSAYRSVNYQADLIRNKLDKGQRIEDILEVSAAPGFSEHHSGCAIDITTPDFPVLEEVFEQSEAFAWLTESATGFGFRMSFPRGNPHGVAYEPWHWAWRG
ncbi:D-alanyl-D-alanine carboxypeptidase family protein [Pseudomonadota bacterium]